MMAWPSMVIQIMEDRLRIAKLFAYSILCIHAVERDVEIFHNLTLLVIIRAWFIRRLILGELHMI